MLRDRLIHYHTSGETLPNPENLNLGEIAVQHSDVNPKLIWKKNNGSLVTMSPDDIKEYYGDEKSIVLSGYTFFVNEVDGGVF